ncbi:hypothetical protein N7509_000122 [Penicillium cosmopolitanum]|uniref:Major facilitator superfamily (MFS) profile domain-containing protein n=1 Tax=Penicillium cosmopolitanum TaxID=1131564 RepID=A0A9X0BFD6_9EURO|nr:uncharacterized protein N7509_000122 [Penicillium cosmopolitanum]KAJ5415024.1 hypothetical protein N7509_000122 [Penicillium cosmopolitanum]
MFKSNDKNGLRTFDAAEAESVSTSTQADGSNPIDNMPENIRTESGQHGFQDHHRKAIIIFVNSLGMIICMIATNIVLPVIPILKAEYGLSTTEINMVMTGYMIIQGVSPAFMSVISDMKGRRMAWIIALVVYITANVGLSLQSNYAALVSLRCLQSIGSSCAIPFGFAVAADISSSEKRGKYIGPMQGSVMGAFAFGPAIGGLLANSFGWRSIFWFLAAISGVFLVIYFVFIPETANGIVGNGSACPEQRRKLPLMRLQLTYDTHQSSLHDTDRQGTDRKFCSDLFKAFAILRKRNALILIMYTSLLYFGISALWATTANQFGRKYNLNTLQTGLSFLSVNI